MEVIAIKIPIRSEKKAVKAFLEELKEVLGAEDFNIDNNLLIIKSSKDEIEYSTNYTMIHQILLKDLKNLPFQNIRRR